MKNWFALLSVCCLGLVPARLAAHDYPIVPVHLELRIEPNFILGTIKSNSIYWSEELIASTVPLASQWTQQALHSAEIVVNSFLTINIDGQQVPGQLVRAQLIEEPLRPAESFLQMIFKYPRLVGAQTLTGKSQFFKKYWASESGSHGQGKLTELPNEPDKEFSTIVTLAGHKRFLQVVPIEKPDFTVPLPPYQFPKSGYIKENFLTGLWQIAPGINFAVFFLAVFLFLPKKRHVVAGLIVIVLAAAILFFWNPEALSNIYPFLPWAALLLVSLSALFNFPVFFWLAATAAGSGLWGALWRMEFQNQLILPDQIWFVQIFFLLGKLSSLVIWATLVLAIFWAYFKRQKGLSESMAPIICKTHARFAALFLLVVAVFMLGRIVFR